MKLTPNTRDAYQEDPKGPTCRNKMTVVVPHRHRDENLKRCLLSLATQTRLPHEVIVVDHDNLAAHNERRHTFEALGRMHALNLRFIYGGPSETFCLTKARNRGRREVSTEYMASLDADCAIPAPTLVDAEMWLDRNSVAMIGAPVLYCMEDGFSFRPPWYGTYPSGGFQAFRVADFDRIGGYNELMRDWGYEDRDFMARLLALDKSRQVMMLTYPYFHNWHPPDSSDEKLVEFESRNRELAEKSLWDGKEWRLRSEMAPT